ncbi:aldehyde dehydrogenase family protein [Spongiibacter taiwanensis]|uniref:aldehyde dehydrogenase family protein n=1 Tax=Spongiibacter taiwanensis TaxID=1748242 RepID=UPI002035ABA9|nr:aldehyde dehydrogenase family protein [Spongiibacter taiwanensis]USA41996.1 aldehyde dehydrogenase family protein [Spongiibacter taiwanensis]
MNNKWQNLIAGEWREPLSASYMSVISPVNGQVVTEIPKSDEGDVNDAVAAARAAFESAAWREITIEDRSNILTAIAHAIGANAVELAKLDVDCCGGTITRLSSFDVPAAIDIFMFYANAVMSYPFVQHGAGRPLPELWHAEIFKEPVGVCGLITAWNAPLLLLAMKLAPALAAGCTVVVKPSELTPTSALRLAEIVADILPPGVVNVVTGEGSVVGEAMSLHPGIDKISFTGSTRIGERIQRNGSTTTKRVALELGGKGAGIVMPDADLDLTIQGAAFGVLLNTGQACESGTRLLVHKDMYQSFTARLAEFMSGFKSGNPYNPDTGIGAVSSKAHLDKILAYVASARDEGASILCGGHAEVVEGCESGFYMQPTVIANASNDMTVAKEEIFGPVITVIPYSTIDEAVNIANDTCYGLSAGIWTGDIAGAQSLARRLDAGSVWINDWHMIRSDLPFGGYKRSGIGREMGFSGLEAYLETKVVTTSFERDPRKKALHSVVLK